MAEDMIRYIAEFVDEREKNNPRLGGRKVAMAITTHTDDPLASMVFVYLIQRGNNDNDMVLFASSDVKKHHWAPNDTNSPHAFIVETGVYQPFSAVFSTLNHYLNYRPRWTSTDMGAMWNVVPRVDLVTYDEQTTTAVSGGGRACVLREIVQSWPLTWTNDQQTDVAFFKSVIQQARACMAII